NPSRRTRMKCKECGREIRARERLARIPLRGLPRRLASKEKARRAPAATNPAVEHGGAPRDRERITRSQRAHSARASDGSAEANMTTNTWHTLDGADFQAQGAPCNPDSRSM